MKKRTLISMILSFCILILTVYSFLLFLLWKYQDNILYQGLMIPQPKSGLGNWELKRPDLNLKGWVVNPNQPKALVIFGGNAMALSPLVQWLPTCTSRTIYLVPYRGYEGQMGHPSEKALVSDGVAIVQEALKSHPEGVGVLGISLGSGVAMQVAHVTKVDVVGLITPYDSILNVARNHMWGVPVSLLLKDTYDSASIAPFIQTPVFLLGGKYDMVVPPRRTLNLIKSFKRQIDVSWLPTGHNGVWDSKNQVYTCAFIRKSFN